MARRRYRNASPQTTLTAGVNGAATALSVVAVTSWPSSTPYTAVIDYGTATVEAVLVTAVVGTTLTVTRGYDGTSGVSHSSGATVQPMALAIDFDEASAHINTGTGVHGLAGALVDTTTAQTLSAKTLTAPVMTGTATAAAITASGAVTAGSLTVGGNANVSGTLGAGGTGVTSLAVTTTATVGGTLGVTGALSANGGTATTTLSTSGLATLNSATVTGALGVGGVAGLATFTATSGTVTTVGASSTAVATRGYADSPDTFESVQAVATTLTNGAFTAVTWTTEILDDQNAHSTVSNTSRVTPTKAGYYRVSGQVMFASASGGLRAARVAKNGTYVAGSETIVPGPATAGTLAVQFSSPLIQCNGTTDYVEVYAYNDASINTFVSGSNGQASRVTVVFAHA